MKYIILSRPRSGTFLLASQLGDCAGEWFHPTVDLSKLSLALGNAPNPWQWFNGIVVMYEHVPRMLATLHEPYKVIHLTRDNECARLMSIIVAVRTGVWHVHRDSVDVPTPFKTKSNTPFHTGPQEIDDIIRHSRANARNVLNLRSDIHITYEQLVAGVGLQAVCDLLDRDIEDLQPPLCKPSPSYRELIINWEWAEEYINAKLEKPNLTS